MYQHLKHTIPPVYDYTSTILILGSFPSVKSRESAFFYGHPQNRFWRVLAAVFDETTPITIDEKEALLLKHHIAVWDVIDECDIHGSSDSSIRNVIPNDIQGLLKDTAIKRIFVNGKTAEKLYQKYILPSTNLPAVYLPSTSPANAAWSLEKLTEYWKVSLDIRE